MYLFSTLLFNQVYKFIIMGISDYLVKIEELTNTNLELLKALNASFYTHQDHLSVTLDNIDNDGDGVTDGVGEFVIPSFVSLENKINSLQNNFDNLVNAPRTGEAYFTFDGNSRVIEVKKYEYSPSPVILNEQSEFYHENNQILKDFLTPVPYLKIDITNIPNDITSVVIRKVSAITTDAQQRFERLLKNNVSKQVDWGDFRKILEGLNQDEDYILYDTTATLPIREGQGSGSYVIREIVDEYIDDNLDQHIIFKLANDIDGFQKSLTRLLFDQTIEKRLEIGEYMVSWDGRVKFQIEDLNFNTNTIKMRVCFGDYTDMVPFTETSSVDPSQISEMSKLRYFSSVSNEDLFENDKYVKVPLEEDKYIYISIAPLNNRMNIRAPWGGGIIVDTDKLVTQGDSEQTTIAFRDYYATCRNIGDILNEISKVMSNTTTSHSNDELNAFMAAKPVIENKLVKVIHINKHLDETTTIKNIRALYSQKNSYNADLTETQNSLTVLQEQLSAVDFEDTTGIRVKIQNQIDELTKHKNELVNSLIKISDEIALTANNSLVPIENAKYRIRGFFDFVGFANTLAEKYNISEQNIKGILVQYRYRNVQQETGTAVTFVKDRNGDGNIDGDETFIFSDWNRLNTPLRPRIRTDVGGKISYIAEPDNSNKNTPSFNQIDIPITQGEIVDVRLKVIYDFGYPFIQMMSDWSDVVEFTFPEEFIKDVDVTTIISENNSDIETNRFNSILSNNGVIEHVNDKILDQDITYFHKPESISSGFYTPERRIIPLRDKLKDMDDKLVQLIDEITGDTSDQLQVSIDYDESSIIISPYEVGNVVLKSYNSFDDDSSTASKYGNYEKDGGVVKLICNIRLTNISDHSLKIFPMFPGTDDKTINELQTYKFDKDDFYKSKYATTDEELENSAVWISTPIKPNSNSVNRVFKAQTTNQIITFRTKNPWDGSFYYKYETGTAEDRYLLPADKANLEIGSGDNDMIIYPYLIKENGLKLTYKETAKYMLLNKSEDIVIPFMVQYQFTDGSADNEFKKTISFDIRTSLYSDPYTYSFTVTAPKEVKIENKLVSALTKQFNNKEIKNLRYRSIVR